MNPIYIDEDLDVGHNDIADVIAHVEATAIRGNPESALAALDVYGYTKKQHMSVGDLKGKIIDDIIVTNMPKVFVEIGGFLGYLAIRFARLLPPSSLTSHYYSFEIDPVYSVCCHSHEADCVCRPLGPLFSSVVQGAFNQTAPATLLDSYGAGCVDIFFIDHWKEMYLSDFRFIEEKGFCRSGSIVIADNCMYPGCSDYLAYIETAPCVKSTELNESTPNETPSVSL